MCPPTRTLKWNFPLTQSQLLNGTEATLGSLNDSLIYSLPSNYRPPSSLGNNIPTTSNFYNAAPDQPKYNNRFDISKRTGVYKNCLGKSTRTQCACSDEARYLMQQDQSDCVDKVIKVLYVEKFVPKFVISQSGLPTVFLTSRYTLTELNSRTDYCLSCIYYL